MFSVVCFFNKRRGKSHSQTFLEEASYFPLVSRSRTSCLLCHYLNAFSSNKLLLSVCLRPSFSYLDIGEATCCTSSLEGIPCGIWLCLQSAPSRREVVLLFSILIFSCFFRALRSLLSYPTHPCVVVASFISVCPRRRGKGGRGDACEWPCLLVNKTLASQVSLDIPSTPPGTVYCRLGSWDPLPPSQLLPSFSGCILLQLP